MPIDIKEASLSSQKTEASTPQKAQKPLNPLTFNELDLARVLQTQYAGQNDIDTRATAPIKEKPNVTQDTDKPDMPTDESEEVLSQTEENASDETETEVVETAEDDESSSEQQTDEEADSKRYSERTKARIEKLANERKEAKEKADALERELTDARKKLQELEQIAQTQPAPDVGQFGNVWDANKLQDEFSKARDLKRWCEDNADGVTINDKEYSEKDIREIKRKVEDAIEIHIPRRLQFLNQYQQIRPQAEKIYPWLKDRNNPLSAEAEQVKRLLPQITNLPEHEVLIGDFLEGRRLRLERTKAAQKPTPKPTPKPAPRQPGIPSTGPARIDKAKAQTEVASKRYAQSGNERDLTKLLIAQGLV